MAQTIQLPDPDKTLDTPLMQALANRKTTRKWIDEPVSLQELSNLLWAACGITKPKKGKTKSKRTVPSACNSQEIRVYVLLETGAYLYEEECHELKLITDNDIREYMATQKMMKLAPVGLVFVADLSRMASPVLKKEEAKNFTAWVDTGFVSQNVYLYCAAANLGTAVLALVKRDILSKHMGLKEQEKIVLTQVVGHM